MISLTGNQVSIFELAENFKIGFFFYSLYRLVHKNRDNAFDNIPVSVFFRNGETYIRLGILLHQLPFEFRTFDQIGD